MLHVLGLLTKYKTDVIMKQVGTCIKTIRLTNGLSQECVAFQLGLTQQAYSKIEKGQTDIKVSQLRQIAMVLGVCVTEFFIDSSKGTDNRRIITTEDGDIGLK
jgi:transcriptional regulator with XRE-family HTH domain